MTYLPEIWPDNHNPVFYHLNDLDYDAALDVRCLSDEADGLWRDFENTYLPIFNVAARVCGYVQRAGAQIVIHELRA